METVKAAKDAIESHIEESEETSGQAARFALQAYLETVEGLEGESFAEYLDGSPSLDDGVEWAAEAVNGGLVELEAVCQAIDEYETGTNQPDGETVHDRLDDVEARQEEILSLLKG